MNRYYFLIGLLFLISACTAKAQKLPLIETGSVTPMPVEWIDKDTGYKITHLVPGESDNQSFYFHNNPYLPANGAIGEKMVFYRKVNNNPQIFSVDL